MRHTFDDNRSILLKCLAGDDDAREIFVRRYSSLVYEAVAHTLSAKQVGFSRYDLEDLHNTVFLSLFKDDCKKLRQYEGKNNCSVGTWIRVITVRSVLDHLKKKSVDGLSGRWKHIPVEDVLDLATCESTPLEWLEEKERQRLLHESVKNLFPRDRIFWELHFSKGVPVQEVAEIMGITSDNAYTLKHRLVRKIRFQVEGILKKKTGT